MSEHTPDIVADADLGAIRTEELHAAAEILGVHEAAHHSQRHRRTA